MKFTCTRDNLIEGLNIVQKAIPGRSNTPVLEGLLIEVSEDLILTGSDSEISITYQFPAIIEEIGGVVVSSKTFCDIIRKLPDMYVTVETSADGNDLIINSGGAHFEINLMNRAAYPKINFLSTENSFSINKGSLRSLIKQTAFAASLENSRPILKGVLMENKENILRFVAIDGFRLALKYVESNCENDFSIVVPARVLNELSKIIDKDEELINVCFSENQIMFYTDNFKVVSSLLKGEFFDYSRMIPSDFTAVMNVGTKELLGSIERVALVLEDDRKWPLVMKTYSDEVVINVAGERVVSREVVSAEISGQEIEIYYNSRNIMDCLKAVENERISVKFTTTKGPSIIVSEEDDSFLFLVMPVKPKIR